VTVAAVRTIDLQPELVRLKQELLDARERAHQVTEGVPPSAWSTRPASGGWCIGECLMHLNLTSERFVPLLDEGLRALRSRGLPADARLRRDLVGFVLSWMMEPPVRVRISTLPPFRPAQIDPVADVLERFDYLQGELVVRLERGAGLALDRQQVVSPFNARIRYNVYSAFCILAAHQRRHLWQAGRVRAEIA
jgi:DinB family protein